VSLPGIGMPKIKDPASNVVFLKPKDLNYMSVNGLTSLAAYIRLGILPQPHQKFSEEMQLNY
jgi:hypothetical protein